MRILLHMLTAAASTGLGLLLCTGPALAGNRPQPDTCTYDLQVWNVIEKRSTNGTTVRHAYADLLPEEVDAATGCTVCVEDQVRIDLPQLQPFFICHRVASRVRSVVSELIRNNEPIQSIVAYHVIRSRGTVDKDGNRKEFSNHSFGLALDINPELNGLYENCVSFGPQCRLLRGGEWHPGVPGTVETKGAIATAFKNAGFRWGGEIIGNQKDFMHFSLTGY